MAILSQVCDPGPPLCCSEYRLLTALGITIGAVVVPQSMAYASTLR